MIDLLVTWLVLKKYVLLLFELVSKRRSIVRILSFSKDSLTSPMEIQLYARQYLQAMCVVHVQSTQHKTGQLGTR